MDSKGESESAKWLSPQTTLEDVLQFAAGFEQAAFRFYRNLAERVNTEVRPLVLDLAAEEKGHTVLLRRIARGSDVKRQLGRRVVTPPSTEKFDAYVSLYDLPVRPTEEDVLVYAESREHIACEHYGYLAQLTPPGRLQDLFAFLRDEEKRHEAEIRARWSSMFSIF